MGLIRTFRDLHVFQDAFALAMDIFELSKGWPKEERYELTSQVRRSSRSVCASTVEAWRKRRYPAAFRAKLNDAETEAAETRCWLDVALACGYMSRQDHDRLDGEYDALVGRLVRMIQQADEWAIDASESAQKVPNPSSPHQGTEAEEEPSPERSAARPISSSPGSTPRRKP